MTAGLTGADYLTHVRPQKALLTGRLRGLREFALGGIASPGFGS